MHVTTLGSVPNIRDLAILKLLLGFGSLVFLTLTANHSLFLKLLILDQLKDVALDVLIHFRINAGYSIVYVLLEGLVIAVHVLRRGPLRPAILAYFVCDQLLYLVEADSLGAHVVVYCRRTLAHAQLPCIHQNVDVARQLEGNIAPELVLHL